MPQIACIGDSLTEGGFNGGYPASMEELLRQAEPNSTWSHRNYGQRGSSALDWVNKSTSHLVAGCDVIIVMLGTNDAQTGTYRFDEQQFTMNLTTLCRRLMSEAPGATLLLAIPPPAVPGGSFTQYFDHNIINTTYPRIIPQIATSLGVECVNCFVPFGGTSPNSQVFSDGVHLEKSGIMKLATTMSAAVRRAVSGKRGAPNQLPQQNQPLLQPTPNQPLPTQSLELPGISSKNGYLGSAPNGITSPSLLGTPSVQNMQEGSIIEIYTKTLADWYSGKITAISLNNVTVEFVTKEGKTMTKTVPLPSSEVRFPASSTPNGVINGTPNGVISSTPNAAITQTFPLAGSLDQTIVPSPMSVSSVNTVLPSPGITTGIATPLATSPLGAVPSGGLTSISAPPLNVGQAYTASVNVSTRTL